MKAKIARWMVRLSFMMACGSLTVGINCPVLPNGGCPAAPDDPTPDIEPPDDTETPDDMEPDEPGGDPTPDDDEPSAPVPVPVAVDDAYETPAATTLDVLAADGVLSNDEFTEPATVTAFDAATVEGGSVAMNADGSFTYGPPSAFDGDDTFTYTIEDAGGSAVATVTITVLPEEEDDNGGGPRPPRNAAPVANDDAFVTDEATPIAGDVYADNGNGPDSDSDGDPLTTTEVDGAGLTTGVPFALASGAMLTMNADGTFTYDPNGQFDALNTGDIGLDMFTYTIDDGNGGSDTATVTISIDGITIPASAQNDAYASTGNVGINVPAANGVFVDNGSGADGGDTLTVTAVQGLDTNVGTATPTVSGGSVTLNTDGSFTYDPPAGFLGDDTFTYTIDNALNAPSQATVTITVSTMIWFVDNAQPINGDGRLSSPFNTIGGLAAANDQAGDTIFIHESGSGPYDSNLVMENGQYLIGQGATAPIVAITGIILPPHSKPLPATGGGRPMLEAAGIAVAVRQNNTLRGLNIGNAGSGLSNDPLGGNFGTLTVSEVAIGGTGRAVNLAGSGLLQVTLDSITSTSIYGLFVQSLGGVIDGNLTVTGTTAISNSSLPSIRLLGTSAHFNFGMLNITNTTTHQPGFEATDITGTITTAAGTINTGSATAITIDGPAGRTPLNMTLTSVSVSGAAAGIKLIDTSGSFTITGAGSADGSGGTIQNITNRGVEIVRSSNIVLNNMTFTNASTVDGPTCTNLDNSGCNAAIHMAESTGIGLTNVDISGSAQQGINGLNVSGFTLLNSTVTQCGNEVSEGCLRLVNLGGTAAITNSNLSFPAERVAQIENTDTTLNLTVSGSTFRDTQSSGIGADGLEILSRGASNTTVDIVNSFFLRNQVNGLQVLCEGASFTSADVTGSTFDRGAGSGRGLDFLANDTSTLHFNVIGNPLINSRNGNVVTVSSAKNARIQGRINQNMNIQAGGSFEIGFGIQVSADDATNVTLEIINNMISNIGSQAGIQVLGRGSGAGRASRVDATISNNSISVDPTWGMYDIWLEAQNGGTVCGNVTNNATSAMGHPAFRVRTTTADSTVILQGNGATAADVWSNNGNTPAAGPVSSVQAGTLTLGGTCNTVTHPLP